MAEQALDILIGDQIQLEIGHDGRGVRHTARVIGMLPGASLLVPAPVHDGKLRLVRHGLRLVDPSAADSLALRAFVFGQLLGMGSAPPPPAARSAVVAV